MLWYIRIGALLAVILVTSFTTHHLTMNAVNAKQLIVERKAQEQKLKTDAALSTVVVATEVKKEVQEKLKVVTKIKVETVIENHTIYRDAQCNLEADGLKLLNDTANSLNATR